MEKYFKDIYQVLFDPDNAFNRLKALPCSSQAAFTIIWVNIISYSLRYIFTSNFLNIITYFFTLIFYLLGVLFSWLIAGIFFEYIAKVFDKSGKLKILLYLSSFAVIPWILIPPLELMKNTGDIGYFFSVILELLVYFWTIFLYTKALQYTYDLKFSRSIMLIFLPFAGMFFAFFWTIGFFTKISYIFTV